MKLRESPKSDADFIQAWISSEEELYKWSADRFNKFPLEADDINQSYDQQIASGRFIPLSYVDECSNTFGHFIIRYPRDDDDTTVRFGFVIIEPFMRGVGFGRNMLLLGIEYVRENLKAKRIDLGVFANNPKAFQCYQSLGFKEYGRRICKLPIGDWECIDMELFLD